MKATIFKQNYEPFMGGTREPRYTLMKEDGFTVNIDGFSTRAAAEEEAARLGLEIQ